MLEKETNIVEIIKSRRYVNKALHFLLTKRQRKYLKERTRYVNLTNEKTAQKTDQKTGNKTSLKQSTTIRIMQGIESSSDLSEGFNMSELVSESNMSELVSESD